MTSSQTVLRIFIAVAVVLLLSETIAGGIVSDRETGFYHESKDWCDDHGGELSTSHVIGWHGGLHCDLPNGTSVHMSEVVGGDD